MKGKKALCALLGAILALALVACGGSSNLPPFSKVELGCTEEDVVNKYGMCTELTSNADGKTTYSYPCTYQGKAGKLFINFAADGRSEGIIWSYNAQSEDEQTALVDSIVNEYTEKLGKPDLIQDLGTASDSARIGSATVWNLSDTGVTLLDYKTLGNYNLQIVYSTKDESGSNADAPSKSSSSIAPANTIYHKGDTAEGSGFKLTVDKVDATPEFADYEEADAGTEYFFVSFELENTSNAALSTTSLFHVFADGQECNTVRFLDPYNGVDWFDTFSDLAAGRKVKNYISANVPEGWTEVQLVCKDGTTFSFTRSDLGDISATGSSSEDTIYHLGEVLTRNGMEITLTKVVQTDYVPYLSTMYYEPDAGNHFVIMMFDIKNVSSQTQTFNALTTFDLYVDDYSSNFTSFFADYDGLQDLSDQNYVELLSGKMLSGYKVVEVPDGWQKIELVTRQGTIEVTPDVAVLQ